MIRSLMAVSASRIVKADFAWDRILQAERHLAGFGPGAFFAMVSGE